MLGVKEETAIVLDFLPHGYPFDTKPGYARTAIAQAIGKAHFTLLELIPKKGVFLNQHEEVYIGEGKRDKIHHVSCKLALDKLTQTARIELEHIIASLVKDNEQKFVEFFNKCGPVTSRRHQLELIPGIGKKHMLQLLEEREKEVFKSFEDIKKRVKLLPDPENAVIKRILSEINNEDKYKLFVY